MDIASAGSSEAVSVPPAESAVRRSRVTGPLAVAVGLVVVQLAVRGWVAGGGFFYWDDLILAGRAGRFPLFSANLLLYDHDGHFMPAAFAVAWVITRLGPYVWAGPVISMLVLQLIASASVLRMLLVLTSPEYGASGDVESGRLREAAESAVPRGDRESDVLESPGRSGDATGYARARGDRVGDVLESAGRLGNVAGSAGRRGAQVGDVRESPGRSRGIWLRGARGARWAILIPLAFYLFCPLTLPAFAWWSAALNALPLQIALAWVVGDAVLLIRTGRVRYAVAGCVVLVGALLFFEKSVIVPFVAFVVAVLVRYVDGRADAIRTVARRGARLWIGSAVVLMCWGAIYLTVVHVSAVRSDWAGVRALLHHAISRGIVPALVGGPWDWERWLPSTPWAVPPAWTVVLAWLVIGAVVVFSIRTRRRVWPVWAAVVVYVLAAQLPVALIRGGPNTTDELTQSLRYLADLAVPLTVAGALLLRAGPRRADRRGLRPPIAIALVTAFVVSSLWSTVTFSRSWSASPTRVYLTTVKSELAAGGPPLLEQEVPWKVLNPLAYPLNRISVALSPLAPPTMFAHATPHLRMITDDGRIVDAAVWWNRGIRRGPVRGCGYSVSGTQPVPIPLDGPMIDNAWTAQLNYLASRDGQITVALEHGETVVAPVRAGLNTVYVRVIGGGNLMRIGTATPGLHLCLGAGPVGVASYSG
ncbi:hypothetical protein [Nocardia miyunensis]|uniref:hypothetical protein n=1 Tax=Nocardia miyunensis TaxID=282684 RepID=UPI00083299A7|nr:hypothetical protein [Nocardia miyunensis]